MKNTAEHPNTRTTSVFNSTHEQKHSKAQMNTNAKYIYSETFTNERMFVLYPHLFLLLSPSLSLRQENTHTHTHRTHKFS